MATQQLTVFLDYVKFLFTMSVFFEIQEFPFLN